MSSDVYIDLSNNPQHAADPGADSSGETIRIGHLGEMSYFGYDILQALYLFCDAEPTIQPHLIAQLNRLAERFESYRKDLADTGDEYFCIRWGYHKPDPWDDVPEPGDFDELADYIGWHWRVRVD